MSTSLTQPNLTSIATPKDNKKVPIATFEDEDDLEDDFQFVPIESPSTDEEWTCKKCTLVNQGSAKACEVCGGSKLRSTSTIKDQTLRKGEFWACVQCTLKNSIATTVCGACKAGRQVHTTTTSSTQRQLTQTTPTSGTGSGSGNSLMPPVSRISRSPSPNRHRGAIPKRHSTGAVISARAAANPNRASLVAKTWHCPACTYENSAASVVCDICSSHRSRKSESIPQNIGIPAEDSRHESKLMENLRKVEEAEALSKWENIIQYCKENSELFVDDSFPPAAKSLYYNPSAHPEHPVVQWRRPFEIHCDGGNFPWAVFRTPLPSDICQGVLGNCWLLSALAVLAEREDLVKEVVVTKDTCPQVCKS